MKDYLMSTAVLIAAFAVIGLAGLFLQNILGLGETTAVVILFLVVSSALLWWDKKRHKRNDR